MSFKTTGILMALVVLGAVVVLFTGEGGPSEFDKPRDDATDRKSLVLDPKPDEDDIVRITVVNEAGEELAFEHGIDLEAVAEEIAADMAKPPAQLAQETAQGIEDALAGKVDRDWGPWEVVSPVKAAVEQWMVDNLPRTLLGLESQRSFAPGEGEVTLAEAGLEPPRGSIALTTLDRETYTFAIGGKAALSNNTYVLVERPDGSRQVHVVARDLSTEIERKLKDYRSKTIFPRDRGEPVALEITHEGQQFVFNRNDADQWIVQEPVRTHADNQAVQRLLNRALSLTVREFIDDEPASLARYGLEPPELTITVRARPKTDEPAADQAGPPASQPAEPAEVYTLQVGGFADLDKTMRYVKRGDQAWVAGAPNTTLDQLVPKFSELRDSRVVRLGAGEVTQIELTRGDRSVTLTKSKGDWRGDGDLASVEFQAVQDLLSALEDVRAIDYVDQPGPLSEYGLDEPRATLTVTTSAQVDPITIRVGGNTPSGRNTYVQVAGQSSVLVLDAAQAGRLAVDPDALRSRKLFALRIDDITAIESTYRGRTRRVEKLDNDWEMTAPPGRPIDAGALRDVLNDLGALRARAVLGRRDFAEHGLDEPDAVVTFTVAEEAGPQWAGEHTLRLALEGQTVYARKDDEPYVFELDPTVVPSLTGELIERRLLIAKPDDVQRLELRAGEVELVFDRQGDGWQFASDPYVKVLPDKVSQTLERLTNLRVERYLAYEQGDVQADDLASPEFTAKLWLRPAVSGDDELAADESAADEAADEADETDAGAVADKADAQSGADEAVEPVEVITLKFSHADELDGTRSGAWVERQRTFVLPKGAVDDVRVSLPWFLGEEPDPQDPAAAGFGPQ